MQAAGPLHNLHTVWSYCGILCVRCKTCGNRKAKEFPNTKGNYTLISSLKFKCDECGGRDVECFLPADENEAEGFVARR
jgi:hypothetical protein